MAPSQLVGYGGILCVGPRIQSFVLFFCPSRPDIVVYVASLWSSVSVPYDTPHPCTQRNHLLNDTEQEERRSKSKADDKLSDIATGCGGDDQDSLFRISILSEIERAMDY